MKEEKGVGSRIRGSVQILVFYVLESLLKSRLYSTGLSLTYVNTQISADSSFMLWKVSLWQFHPRAESHQLHDRLNVVLIPVSRVTGN